MVRGVLLITYDLELASGRQDNRLSTSSTLEEMTIAFARRYFFIHTVRPHWGHTSEWIVSLLSLLQSRPCVRPPLSLL